jgi:hypothetical protein
VSIVISILAIFGIFFALKEADGPFDLMLKLRLQLFRVPYLGVFFYKLFECPFCLGCWAGLSVYLLQPFPIVLWFLAGGAVCLFGTGLMGYLFRSKDDQG